VTETGSAGTLELRLPRVFSPHWEKKELGETGFERNLQPKNTDKKHISGW